jgi:hypothetical protein
VRRSTSAGAFHGERVYIANQACAGHTYKPSRVTLACGDGNLYATGIAYSAYGQRVAVATATMHLNDCVPNCAIGRFHSYKGSLRFRDLVRCKDGLLYYSRPLQVCQSIRLRGGEHLALSGLLATARLRDPC